MNITLRCINFRFKDIKGNDGNKYSFNPCNSFTEGQCVDAAVINVLLIIKRRLYVDSGFNSNILNIKRRLCLDLTFNKNIIDNKTKPFVYIHLIKKILMIKQNLLVESMCKQMFLFVIKTLNIHIRREIMKFIIRNTYKRHHQRVVKRRKKRI